MNKKKRNKLYSTDVVWYLNRINLNDDNDNDGDDDDFHFVIKLEKKDKKKPKWSARKERAHELWWLRVRSEAVKIFINFWETNTL